MAGIQDKQTRHQLPKADTTSNAAANKGITLLRQDAIIVQQCAADSKKTQSVEQILHTLFSSICHLWLKLSSPVKCQTKGSPCMNLLEPWSTRCVRAPGASTCNPKSRVRHRFFCPLTVVTLNWWQYVDTASHHKRPSPEVQCSEHHWSLGCPLPWRCPRHNTSRYQPVGKMSC